MKLLSLLLLSASTVESYSWVARQPGVDLGILKQGKQRMQERASDCPYNPNHKPGAPITTKFPYLGARDGIPGHGRGGIKVPADGDHDHSFMAPTANDIRGPCPGLNVAANYNFIARDGVTTFTEMLDAVQNMYNMGYDLALVLATLAIVQDGDITTGRVSIGCDATSRTSGLVGNLLGGRQPGINSHSRFETDASLTRNDYFTGQGDNFSMNVTLWADMVETANRVSGGRFEQSTLAAFRAKRYDESVSTNDNFFFGPLGILLYGASSFLYELFAPLETPHSTDLATMSAFFGVERDEAGNWAVGVEHIPEGWRNRESPYSIVLGAEQILAQYLAYPRLFGGNVGRGNFDAISDFGAIVDGRLVESVTSGDVVCLILQLAVNQLPNAVGQLTETPLDLINFATGLLSPLFTKASCPMSIL